MQIPKAAEIAKFLTALVGAASIATTQGLLSGSAAEWTAIGISIVTAAAVFLVPNATPASTPATDPPVVPPMPPEADVSPPVAPTPQPGLGAPHGGGEATA